MWKYLTIIPIITSILSYGKINTKLTKTRKKLNRLKMMVMATETSTFRIYLITAKMACKVMINSVIGYFKRDDKTIGKNLYEIEYSISNKTYKMIIKTRPGPCPIENITNEKGENITDIVLPYMGQKYDWYEGKPMSPSFFMCTTLKFQMTNGTTQIINE